MLTGKQAICGKYLIPAEYNCISTCHSLELNMSHGLAHGRIQGETLSGNRSQETSRRSFVISPSGTASGILGTEMPRSKRADKARRAPRVKLAGTILALLRLDNGREVRARLHQLSFTGGLLHLEKPLDEGIKAGGDVPRRGKHHSQQSCDVVSYVGHAGLSPALRILQP